MIKVAVILINYNDYAQRFLKDCIESLDKVVFEMAPNVNLEELKKSVLKSAFAEKY